MTPARAQTEGAPSGIGVRRFTPRDGARCAAYIEQHTDGNIFHHAAWRDAAKAAYSADDVSLLAERDGAVVGFLPLVEVRGPLLGSALVSTAFSVGGGPVADDDATLGALTAAAARLGAARGARYVELRGGTAPGRDWLARAGLHASFAIDLETDETMMLAALPRKRRAEIRKALALEGAGDLSLDAGGGVEDFYPLYARAMRDHGTPVFPRRFLSCLVAEFGAKAEITLARLDGKPAAALVSFYDKGAVYPYYIGAAPAARRARCADYLYWKLMTRAIAKGCTRFDFGRSRVGSGPAHYKATWGAAARPLVHHYHLVAAGKVPDARPTNPRYAGAVAAWRRLPLPVANRLGPLIAGNFP